MDVGIVGRYAGAGARRGEPRSRRGAPLLLLVAALLLATGVALAGVGATLTAARPIAAPAPGRSATNADLVRRFYAAVDHALQIGDTTGLDGLVAPDLAWCDRCPDGEPSVAGLKRYLTDLHQTAPGLRIAAESVVADGDQTVTARVRVTGASTVGSSIPWGPVDTLRLDGGMIAERRSGPDGIALVEPLLGARLPALPPAVTGVAMARLTFPVGAGVEGLLSAGPTLLLVERGEIAFRTARGGSVIRAGAAGEERVASAEAGLGAVVGAGDAAIVPPGIRYALAQHGEEPAVAVGASLFFADEGDQGAPRPPRPDLALFAAAVGVDPETSPPGIPPAVAPLASGKVEAWPPGPVHLALGRVVLGPGGRIDPPAGESLLLAVEMGSLGVGDVGARTVAAGGGAVRPAGSVHGLRNAGSGPLVMLMLTIVADG